MLIGPMEIAAVTAVPALLALTIPRRALRTVMVAWVVSPLVIYIGFFTWETLTRPTPGNPFSTALYGLALIGPIVAPLWFVICVAGFGVGFGLRRLLRLMRRTRPNPQPMAAHSTQGTPARTAPDAPAQLRKHPAWRQVHLGFDNDGLRIGGLGVWRQKWRPTSEPPVRLPHPAYPAQMHSYEVFAIGDVAQPVCFAACELSNSVWGFFVRGDDPVEAQGISADGLLRYEHRLVTPVGRRSVVLTDVASEEVLLDCAAWESSEVTPRPDGSLFLRLGQNSREIQLRIDPRRQSFRDVGVGGPDHPLTEMADALDEVRRAIGP